MICERQDSAYERIRNIVMQEYSGEDIELVSGAFFELIRFCNGSDSHYRVQVLKALNNFSNLSSVDRRITRTVERIRWRIEEIIEASELQPA